MTFLSPWTALLAAAVALPLLILLYFLKLRRQQMRIASTRDEAMLAGNRVIWTDLMVGAPDVTLAFFEDTRHFIMDDRPAELDLAIEYFLAGKPVQGYSAPSPPDSQPASQPASRPEPVK